MLFGLKLTRTSEGVTLAWSDSGGQSGLLCCPTMEDLAETFTALLWRLASQQPLPPPEPEEELLSLGGGAGEGELTVGAGAESAAGPA